MKDAIHSHFKSERDLNCMRLTIQMVRVAQ